VTWAPDCSPSAQHQRFESRWLDAAESVILYGPVGVGKTHVAQALGHAVARRGGDVRFAKTSRVLSDLAGGHADRGRSGARKTCGPKLVPDSGH
jgi:DNA replication protein DnaC